MTKKIRPPLRAWPLISRAVEDGIGWGLRRARKHLDADQQPTEEALAEQLHTEIMNALEDIIDFGE